MIYELLNHYLLKEDLDQRMIPLAVDVLTPDCYLYLYAGRDDWLVVVEADYLFMKDVPEEIEKSFPVKVGGWYTLTGYQKKTGQGLLPAHVFKSDRVDESDEDWEHYHGVVYQEYGQKYALLRVDPKPGVGPKDFGLTYYTDG